MKPKKDKQQSESEREQILWILEGKELLCEEIAARLNIGGMVCSAHLRVLENAGKVFRIGKRQASDKVTRPTFATKLAEPKPIQQLPLEVAMRRWRRAA